MHGGSPSTIIPGFHSRLATEIARLLLDVTATVMSMSTYTREAAMGAMGAMDAMDLQVYRAPFVEFCHLLESRSPWAFGLGDQTPSWTKHGYAIDERAKPRQACEHKYCHIATGQDKSEALRTRSGVTSSS
jgi:hypothetical protein